MIKLKPFIRLPERLAMPLALLVTGALLLSASLVSQDIDRIGIGQAHKQLEVDREVLSRWLAQRFGSIESIAALTAQKPEVVAAIGLADPGAVQETLDNAAKAAGMQWAVLIDAQGRPLSVAPERAIKGLYANAAAITQHLPGPAALTHKEKDLLWMWAHPVPATEGYAGGAIVFGQALNRQWVQQFSPMVRSHLVMLERERADGPWQAAPGAHGTPWPVAGWPQREGPTANSHVRPIALGEHPLLVNTLPLMPKQAQDKVALALLESPQGLQAPWREAAQTCLILIAAAMSLGTALVWVQGWRLRRGLILLRKWAVASVDMDNVTVPQSTSSSELYSLAHALEELRKNGRLREAEIRHTAFKDPLTLLPNREQFRKKLKAILDQLQPAGRGGAVLLLDIQRFKHINEVLGYANGDRLLRLVAQRLGDQLPGKHDVLARVGGNAFACALPLVDAATAQTRVQALIACFEQPFMLDEQAIDLRANVGLTVFPQNGDDSNALISRAELAMFTSRKRHADWLPYDPSMDAANPASLSLLSDLKLAIERQELRLFLQPKVDLQTGLLNGAEALMRWKHPVRGMVPPDRFIPFAEQSGFIRTLSLWAVEDAARLWRQLHDQGMALPISVNLSTRDLIDKDLPDKLAHLVKKQGARPQGLVLEITESATMDDPEHAHQCLARLHQLGFGLSIDDFGTGYSSLAYLKNLPVHELKIDRSFVMNMERDLNDARIVRSTIDLAHNLGLKVVAEGLESGKAWKILSALKCDTGQGYLISKPIPSDEFATWARQWKAPSVTDEHLATGFADIL